MIGIISCLAGVLGMLALWSLAWWLWRQSGVPQLPPEDRHRRPGWPSHPIPRRTPSIPPPSWLFGPSSFERPAIDEHGDGVPYARMHPSSSANTSRYSREQLERTGSIAEQTEVLSDDSIIDQDEPPAAGGSTCKIGLFAGPRLHDE